MVICRAEMASEACKSIYGSSLPLRAARCAVRSAIILGVAILSVPLGGAARGQQSGAAGSPGPSIVQPGAPGQPTKKLPADTKGAAPQWSQADVDFMQGMIMHHSQAVEMTALIASHTDNKELLALGARISATQQDEIKMMKRWLAARGQATHMSMAGMPDMDASGKPMAMMPGMLTPAQMDALRAAHGAEFDRLFLIGMMQHHNGALIMVKELFDTAGAGQDADIFDFATDADNSQRAEIKIMQSMLEKEFPKEKQ